MPNKSFLDRLKERIDQELGRGQPRVEPVPSTQPPEKEDVSPGFGQRLKEWFTKNPFKKQEPKFVPRAPSDPMLDSRAPLSPDIIRYRIRHAGKTRTLLYMRYSGQFRHVEAYSYRARGRDPNDPTGKKRTLLFYGFCRLHNEIHSFRLDRIEALLITDEPFRERWAIEVA